MLTSEHRSRLTFLGAATIVMTATLTFSPDATAQSVDDFVGSYRYTKSLTHGRDTIHRAFNQALGTMPAILRPLVRNRLTRQELMVSSFRISQTPLELVFHAESPRTWTWGLRQGRAEEVTTPLGSKATLVHRIQGDRYMQQFQGRFFSQTIIYRLSTDRRQMRVDASSQIRFADEPVRYTLHYVRAES